jgi:Protein of unknown function (DUF664)
VDAKSSLRRSLRSVREVIHAGHADILREQLDGAARIATDNPNLPRHDAAWWENYRVQVERAARAAEPDKRG